MNRNDFDRSCRQLRKKYKYEFSEEFLEDLKHLFVRALGQPEELTLELMDYCCPGETFEDELQERMGDIVDLFRLDLDENSSRLTQSDWEYLKDLVNSWAMDMDMDVVTYVMQHIVSQGGFH